MSAIYIVRHGQSLANAHKIVAGQRNSPLTRLGREQARQAGQAATTINPDFIISSPLQRAATTAQLIAEACNYPPATITYDDRLKERYFGSLEGQSYAHNPHHSGDYPEAEQADGIEPLEVFRSRLHATFQELATSPHQRIIIACHQNVGRMLLTIAQGRPSLEMYAQPRLLNATLYKLI